MTTAKNIRKFLEDWPEALTPGLATAREDYSKALQAAYGDVLKRKGRSQESGLKALLKAHPGTDIAAEISKRLDKGKGKK